MREKRERPLGQKRTEHYIPAAAAAVGEEEEEEPLLIMCLLVSPATSFSLFFSISTIQKVICPEKISENLHLPFSPLLHTYHRPTLHTTNAAVISMNEYKKIYTQRETQQQSEHQLYGRGVMLVLRQGDSIQRVSSTMEAKAIPKG